ncbi:hypothetical protein NCAS_0C04680 [Naumovozyma castellii]|uniref:Prokaryotic-type class I peptide chain release factors domain-containing protein n=1 Tax=Naumovozyma castellii TaxID=27288 RepID=G0VD96_NAUCA|nr:hypothetical protein NCAS_0C04680 [Naumovozyma castellii CBS 4309]CCC69458.1 hypothetical protein NCAS_0C04680 [Naumovozyma castellii CBS 4309]
MQRYWNVQSIRWSSSSIEKLASLKEWVLSLNVSRIPLKAFVIRYDRSSGPGGQNVNKVNSKCTLTLNSVSQFNWFPLEIRENIKNGSFRYYNRSSDSIVIQSDQMRSRELNKEQCLVKLVEEIKRSCHFPAETESSVLDKWKKIKSKTDENRLRSKKYKSDRKSLRNKNAFDY